MMTYFCCLVVVRFFFNTLEIILMVYGNRNLFFLIIKSNLTYTFSYKLSPKIHFYGYCFNILEVSVSRGSASIVTWFCNDFDFFFYQYMSAGF